MKIAHLLPATAVFPLKKHNGRYEWALRLAIQQANNGHTVVIYCGGGQLPGSSIAFRALDHQPTGESSRRTQNIALIHSAFEDTSFDIFHSHFDSLGAELAYLTSKPVITTQHWFPDEEIASRLRSNAPNSIIVPLTQKMHDADSEFGIQPSGVIPHGIDLTLFSPDDSAQRNGRLLYVGRITEGKGVKEAVQIATAANLPLDIVGKVNTADKSYYDSFAHEIDGRTIVFHGPKTQAEVATMMQKAAGFLFANIHPEAFGQTIIEAQACGCPVVISDCGANSELIQPGVTGYACKTQDVYLHALQSLQNIKTANCRQFAEQFGLSAMIQAYDDLYSALFHAS